MIELEIRDQMRTYYRVWRELDQVYEDWARAHGFSYYSLLTLYAVWEDREACTQKGICARWVLAKQTVNMILKEFEARGLIRAIPLDADRRVKRITLTPEGEALADGLMAELQALEAYTLRRLGLDRSAAMLEQMGLFVQYLKEGLNGGAL